VVAISEIAVEYHSWFTAIQKQVETKTCLCGHPWIEKQENFSCRLFGMDTFSCDECLAWWWNTCRWVSNFKPTRTFEGEILADHKLKRMEEMDNEENRRHDQVESQLKNLEVN